MGLWNKSMLLLLGLINSSDIDEEVLEKNKTDSTIILILETNNKHGMAEQRHFIFELIKNDISVHTKLK